MTLFPQHEAIQAIAKQTLTEIASTLSPSDSERTIADRAVRMLAKRGVTETWYYNCMAYVLAGPRTCLSISGKDYAAADDEIGPNSLVTIDLSPSKDGIWGDCARSFFLEDGIATNAPRTREFILGRDALHQLHEQLLTFATPDTTFDQLWKFASSEVKALQFTTLDFLGNFGHTIESDRGSRSYLEAGNLQRLGDTQLFTFEPHIKAVDGMWGFKHEEIYYFNDDGRLCVL